MITRDSSGLRLPDLRKDSVALGWFGGLAVLIGAALGVAVASPGVYRHAAALAGVTSLLWAAIRWLGVRLAGPRLLAEDPAALRGAFSLGLLAYAFAVTPELRFAAWLAAGAVTGVTLVRVGRGRREVARAIAFAWGMQAVVVTGGWLARNALLAILIARG